MARRRQKDRPPKGGFFISKTMNKNIFLKQLKELVSFETLTGDIKTNTAALDYVEKLLDKRVRVKRLRNGNAEIMIAGNLNTMSPDIAYLVHIDIVSGQPSQFTMKQVGDKLLGRGVSDMKFSIPIGVALLNSLIKRKSNISFALVITTDEEIGGFDGSFYLAEKLKFRPKVLLVPDGGDNLIFVNKAKGVCQLIVEANGSPAHASRPWNGKNALEPIIKLSNRLLDVYEKNNKKECWETTMNIGQIEGGVSVNQVCPSAVMKLDFRFPETDSKERITKEVTELAKEIDSTLKISPASYGLPTFTDTALPVVKLFLKTMEKSLGKKIEIKETYGASDARHFAKFNIPVLMIKPVGGDIHCDTEWISFSSCMEFYKGLEMFLREIEKNKVL